MYLCVHIYVYVCVCVCISVYVCVCVYIHIYSMYMCIYSVICTCVHVKQRAAICVWRWAWSRGGSKGERGGERSGKQSQVSVWQSWHPVTNHSLPLNAVAGWTSAGGGMRNTLESNTRGGEQENSTRCTSHVWPPCLQHCIWWVKAVVLNRRPLGHIWPASLLFVAPELLFLHYVFWLGQHVLGHSLLRVQFLTFTFVFGADCILTFCQL